MRSVIKFMQNRIFMEEMKLKQGFALFLEYYSSILLHLFEISRTFRYDFRSNDFLLDTIFISNNYYYHTG